MVHCCSRYVDTRRIRNKIALLVPGVMILHPMTVPSQYHMNSVSGRIRPVGSASVSSKSMLGLGLGLELPKNPVVVGLGSARGRGVVLGRWCCARWGSSPMLGREIFLGSFGREGGVRLSEEPMRLGPAWRGLAGWEGRMALKIVRVMALSMQKSIAAATQLQQSRLKTRSAVIDGVFAVSAHKRALQRSARSPCLAAPRSRRQRWRALSTKDETDKEEEAAAPAPDADEAEPVDEAAAAPRSSRPKRRT